MKMVTFNMLTEVKLKAEFSNQTLIFHRVARWLFLLVSLTNTKVPIRQVCVPLM